jgi:hypothetical protein
MRSRGPVLWLLLGALLGAACLGPAGPVAPVPAAAVRAAEPTGASAFLAAHTRGDASLSERVTSPLFWAELSRRGRPDVRLDPFWSEVLAVAELTYLDTVFDERGFGHAFYRGWPRRPGSDGPATVWRLDLDPRGRVIWGEWVRLLDGPVEWMAAEEPVAAFGAMAATLPRLSADLSAGTVFGVRSRNGEGYYAVGLRRDPAQPRPSHFLFVIAGPDGELVSDPWTFGRPWPLLNSDDGREIAPPLDDRDWPEDDRAALRDYLLGFA